jgi:hypothetical protein
MGDAAARSRGVDETTAPLIVFIDADVVIYQDVLQRIADSMSGDSKYAAMFGSYDAAPADPGIVSQYRNLLHHLTHQRGNADAETFWTGLGAIKRKALKMVGGFSSEFNPISDVALGRALKAHGFPILLDRDLLGTHLKAWTLRSMVATDIFRRAVPWTRLILREGYIPNDLATLRSNRLAAASAVTLTAFSMLSLIVPIFGIFVLACLLTYFTANVALFRQFYTLRHATFVVGIVPLHFLHHLCCVAGFSLGLKWMFLEWGRSERRRDRALESMNQIRQIAILER